MILWTTCEYLLLGNKVNDYTTIVWNKAEFERRFNEVKEDLDSAERMASFPAIPEEALSGETPEDNPPRNSLSIVRQ